jgi:hypothetical protein
MAVAYKTITEKQWDALPKPTTKPPSQWDEVLGELEGGKILEIPIPEGSSLKGARIGLARVASYRGFRVEFRTVGDSLYARKSDKPLKERK